MTAPSDRTRTQRASDRSSPPPPLEPWLFVVFRCAQPLAPGAAHCLADVDAVAVGRGAEEPAARAEARRRVVRVNDPVMSSDHLRLEREGDGWALRDAGSKNGTRLNGVDVRRSPLADGDLIEAGDTILRFRARLPVAPAAQPPWSTLLPTLAADFARLATIARSRLPVLLRGETGAGKATVARVVHTLSGRGGALVAFASEALARRGDADTLFLREVADLTASAQSALLAALQASEAAPRRADGSGLRLVSATSADPDALVAEGLLRADLYARLAGHSLTLPPLRERREDLGTLVAAMLPRLAPKTFARVRFDAAAARALLAHDWPRNLHELEQCLAAALVLAEDGTIALDHLPLALRAMTPAARPVSVAPAAPVAHETPGFVREGEFWTVSFEGALTRIKDTDGMRYVAFLVARPNVEVHVADLLAESRGGAPPSEAASDGDAGPMLDARAKEAYRARLDALREELDEATRWGDRERASVAQNEIEKLSDELSRAVGLGGRDRRAGAGSERMRVNVTQRIRGALKKVEEALPRLGHHLATCVRTGVFCCYTPPPRG